MARKSTEVRQQEIIQATLNLIASEGVQGLTTARLATQVDLSEAALYRHFSNKLDIVGATIDSVGQFLIPTLSAAAGSGKTLAKLERVLKTQLRFIEEHPGMARLLFSDEVHFNSDILRTKLYSVIQRYLSFIENLLSEGQTSREVSDECDIKAAAMHFLGLIQAQVLLWSLSGGHHALTSQADQLWVLYKKAVIK